MKKKSNYYLFFFLIIMCLLNLFLLKSNTHLSEINSKKKLLLQQKTKSEISIFRSINYSNQLIEKTITISDLKLEEDILSSENTPLLIMRKDMCSTCKDEFFIQLEDIKNSSTWIQKHLKLILLDENPVSLGSGTENFLRKIVNNLYFIKNTDFKFPSNKNIPELSIVLINSEMKIQSYFEFHSENLYLLKTYIKSLESLN